MYTNANEQERIGRIVERTSTMRRALKYFSNKLTDLVEQDEEIRDNEPLKEDLLLNASDIQHIVTEFDDRRGGKGWAIIEHNDEIVRSVLDCYVKYLVSSKDLLNENSLELNYHSLV